MLALWSAVCSGQEKENHLRLDLTPLLDVSHAFALTPEGIEKEFTSAGYRENPFIRWQGGHARAAFSTQPYSNVSVDLSILDGAVPLSHAEVTFTEGKPTMIDLASEHVDQDGLARLRSALSARLGCSAIPAAKPQIGWKSQQHANSELWSSEKGVALMTADASSFALSIAPPHTLLSAQPKVGGASRQTQPEFFVRLDQIMAVPGLWSLTPEAFEETVRMPGLSFKETPFYKWTTSAKDGVLLTRHVFSNTSTDLLLFDDAVNAEEASIEFRHGKAAKLTLTLLTRGNSGDVTAEKFDAVFKATGRALGALLKVQPTRTIPAGRNLLKEQGYLWTTPHTLALMEFNEDAPKGKVEFLRVKLMPASGRAELLNLAGIGDNATTKSRSSLSSNIKRDLASGDIYLTGVPMIDQGQKGYCVSASCARIFNYMGVKCDQDEIAQVVKNDAERGTRPSDMYAALRKIDQRYNMRVKVVKLPRNYGLAGMRDVEIERAWKGDLVKLIQDNVNAGIPLLWAVELPSSPLVMSARGSGSGGLRPVVIQDRQSGGGHMRLIIGFNTKIGEVLFTDSWGAGHELKRMTVAEANQMTQAVFTMQPTQ